MKKIEDKELIEALDENYHAARSGKTVYGIETNKKAWYFDDEYQAYILLQEKGGKAVMPVLYAVPVNMF